MASTSGGEESPLTPAKLLIGVGQQPIQSNSASEVAPELRHKIAQRSDCNGGKSNNEVEMGASSNTEEDWTVVTRRAVTRRLERAQVDLSKIKEKQFVSKGLFRVVITTVAVDGDVEVCKPFPENVLGRSVMYLEKTFPKARPA